MRLGRFIVLSLVAGLAASSGVKASPAEHRAEMLQVQFYNQGYDYGYRVQERPRYTYDSRSGYWNRDRYDDRGGYGYDRGGSSYYRDREMAREYAREQERLRREWAQQHEWRRIQAEKDAIKDQRRHAKEEYKERVRAWNRANGF